MNKFIVIEDLDGVGKSTATINVANELNFKQMEWITDPFDSFKSILKNSSISEDSKHLLSIASMRHTSDTIRNTLHKGSGVISSRYVLSMIWYYRGYCMLKGLKPLNINPYDLGYIKPDVTIFLQLSEAERVKRTVNRHSSDKGEQLLEKEVKLRKFILNGITKHVDHVLCIDNLSPEKVKDKIISLTN